MPSRSTSASKKRSTSNLQKNAGATLHPIVLYVLETCPYCHNAMELLESAGLKYTKIVVSSDEKEKSKIKAKTGMQTFPMVFVKSTENPESYLRIGGRDDLARYLETRQKILAGEIQLDILQALLKQE